MNRKAIIFQPTLFESGAVPAVSIGPGSDGWLARTVVRRDGAHVESFVWCPDAIEMSHAEFDLAWLRSASPPPCRAVDGEIRYVDLFSGCGALSLGVWEACRALG